MTRTNANDKKIAGRTEENKQAIIKVDEPGRDGALVVEAEHYVVNGDTEMVSIYESARSEGIDRQTHVSRVSINRVETFPGFDFFDDVDEIETSDSYKDIYGDDGAATNIVEEGDWVRILTGHDDPDDIWRVAVVDGGDAVLELKNKPPRTVRVTQLDIVEKHDKNQSPSTNGDDWQGGEA